MKKYLFKDRLNICFKGSRTYVYASDVFMEVIRVISDHFHNPTITAIDFSTHHMAHSKIEIEIYESIPERSEPIHAIFNFSLKEKKYYALVKESGKKITCRYEYPENDLFKTFIINKEDKTIITNSQYSFSIMDVFTSLNKYLLTELFPEIKNGWLSVRTKIDVPFTNNYQTLRVDFLKNFSNKYFQSALFIDNKQIGTLYFSIK